MLGPARPLKRRRGPALGSVLSLLAATGCDMPDTSVVLANGYPASAPTPLVVYDAFWQAVELAAPLAPGASSPPQFTVAASPNTAYALLAPGWDPTSATPPASYVLLESRDGFAVGFDDALVIPIDDAHFAGNCATGSQLAQHDADFLATRVFARELGARSYDAATCTLAGAP